MRAIFLYFVWLCISVPVLANENNFCTLAASGNFSGYRMRDNRCEGIYAQDVSAQLLQIVSFVNQFSDFAAARPAELVIRWWDDSASDVWISGRGRARNSYYGLDTLVPAAQHRFAWSPKILLDKGFGKRQLGFLAWRYADGEKPEARVHLPLVIGHGAETNTPLSASEQHYDLLVRPGEVFKEFFVRLDRQCSDGYQEVTSRHALGRDFYSARRLAHRINVVGPAGVYRLVLDGQREDGSFTSPRQFLFWHNGGSAKPSDRGAGCD